MSRAMTEALFVSQCDYHVQVARAYYAVPHALIGQTADVRLTSGGVEGL